MKTRTPAAFALEAILQRGDRTVADLAEEMGVSSRTVYRWCDGSGRPTNVQALMLDAWTAGTVSPRSWLTGEEAGRVAGMAR